MTIPERWEHATLEGVLDELVERRGDREEFPVLSVTKDRGIMLASERHGREMHGRDLTKYRVAPRDSIVVDPMLLWSGTIGRQRVTDHGVVSPDYRVYLPRRGVDIDFLQHAVRGPQLSGQFRAGARGTNIRRNRISREGFMELSLHLPPLAEQKKIAEILGSVDEAIRATQAVIDQTRKVKQGLLQQLLTRGIGHTCFKQTEIGEIPESWEVVPGGSICEQISVGIVIKPTQYYVESGVRAFRSLNVGEGRVNDRDWVYIDPSAHRGQVRKSALRTGDVLVVRSGAPGTACLVTPEYDDANCIDVIFARPHVDRVIPGFLCWFINSPAGKDQVLRDSGGLAQQHFNVGALKRMMIALPPLEEQGEVLMCIESTMEDLAANEQLLAGLSRLKNGLMSDLLSGRVRVQVKP